MTSASSIASCVRSYDKIASRYKKTVDVSSLLLAKFPRHLYRMWRLGFVLLLGLIGVIHEVVATRLVDIQVAQPLILPKDAKQCTIKILE